MLGRRSPSVVGQRLRLVFLASRRHGLWILAWSLVGWIGTALAPVLTGEPFLLMMLSPRAMFVALATGSVPLLPFVLLGTIRLSVTDASYFIIGRTIPQLDTPAYAPRSFIGRAAQRIARRGDRLCAWFYARPKLAGAFLFLRPNGKYLGMAGAYGVHPVVAGSSAVLGTASFLTALHLGFGAIF